MESQRQERIARLLRKDLGEILQRMSPEVFQRAMITVTKVYVTRDLSIAKVYVSLFAVEDKTSMLGLIRERTTDIRYNLAQRVKKQLRVVPQLEFFIDDSLDYIDKIDQLLKD